jgi:LuxR family maltose regulon positive regulatory protein
VLLKSLAARVQRPGREVQGAQALLSIRADEISSLDWWLAVTAADMQNILPVQKEREAFTLARLQIAAGKPRAALEALQGWQVDAARQGRVRSQVEALCLEALAHHADFDQDLAVQALTQALRRGEAKSFRRLFLDEGMRMVALLQVALLSFPTGLSACATTLLHSFSRIWSRPGAASDVPVEPLSQQERRVASAQAGLSNRDCPQLVVSRNTIKSQVQSIYRKLNVNSRDGAPRCELTCSESFHFTLAFTLPGEACAAPVLNAVESCSHSTCDPPDKLNERAWYPGEFALDQQGQ